MLQAQEKFKGYRSDQIQDIWPIAQPLIEMALERGSIYTIQDIFYGLFRKKMQLWMWGHDAALVTSIQSKAGKTFCLLLTLGGKNMDVWIQHLPIVEQWAKNEGAEEMRVYGRIGWARVTGYDVDYTRMSKCLQDRVT